MKNACKEVVYYHLCSCDSTNSWAKRKLATFDPEIVTVVVSDCQTHGRGRYANSFFSPKGNLFCTICVAKKVTPFFYSQATALAVYDLLKEQFSIDATLKWPNDFLIKGKKVGGVLVEVVHDWTLIGIGLNVNMTQKELKQIPQKATSLKCETKTKIAIADILEGLVVRFLARIEQKKEHIEKEWVTKSNSILGKKATIKTALETIEGHIKAIFSDGSLCLILPDKSEKKITSADIWIES